MSSPSVRGPVERFDRIWKGWADQVPKEERITQHRIGRARLLQALDDIAHRMPVNRILEVGCGSAIDLSLLSENPSGRVLIGLDISTTGLHVAEEFASHLGVRTRLCCGDVFALPFPASTFGLVFSQGLLEHFPDPTLVLQEQVRVLAPGGYLAISVPQTFTGYTIQKRLAILRGKWPWGWEGQFTSRRLTRLAQNHGLDLIHLFGEQYWLSWREPVWVLRDLFGKIHRRNPWRDKQPFALIQTAHERLWNVIERRLGHLFMLNLVGIFRHPA